jgi:hypothetical protein
MFALIALLRPTSAFPFIVAITEYTASGIDVQPPKKIIPMMLSMTTTRIKELLL